jgi:aldose 1-epimerase
MISILSNDAYCMTTMKMMKQEIGLQLFSLNNGIMEVVLCNYGCTIVSINVPDRNGQMKNVVAGFGDPEDYKNDHPYFGCTIGRYANRIAFGKFKIDETEYQLATNDHLNHLHGGINGFSRKLWKAEQNGRGLSFSYVSMDGEEGYPGNLQVTVGFELTEDHRLNISYSATTDQSTIVNLTNHSYFNLSGFESPTIHDHVLKIYAHHYTVKNENNVPSAEIRPVLDTAYDFTQPKLIGKDIDLLTTDMGYDINYVLDGKSFSPVLAAELHDPGSGRLLKVFTDQPGMQLYTANWWDGSIVGQQNKTYHQHGAVALETQAFPDAPNHLNFPDAILRAGQVYHSETAFQFSIL